MARYAAPTHRFAFDGEDKARLFVARLASVLGGDVATYRDGCAVYVVDGVGGLGSEIARLAKMSGAFELHRQG